jgi:hypothetical protein
MQLILLPFLLLKFDFVDDDVIDKKKKKIFKNHDDATHTTTFPVMEVDFVDDDVIVKKKKKKKKLY